ncbi:hypothetical protein PGT21_036925 [Puccinia graminis f. sp. tritici]|uniref:Uncharacterized protein n=1 Tax=Puccinia graminis f. sp. tritici TaxID=56615 RepID=A0A5B0QQA4_PUCGR|nr:hypothetical protein PGT21_036925 [Puccinia graminis f. sp. tritici]
MVTLDICNASGSSREVLVLAITSNQTLMFPTSGCNGLCQSSSASVPSVQPAGLKRRPALATATSTTAHTGRPCYCQSGQTEWPAHRETQPVPHQVWDPHSRSNNT